VGAQWYCDQCGGPLKNDAAIPMAIGVPMPDPVKLVGPMGQVIDAVPVQGGGFMPYRKDPNAIFEVFQLCFTCAAGLAIIFKEKKKLIRYVPVVNDKPLDS
jgi:hypothetical protein